MQDENESTSPDRNETGLHYGEVNAGYSVRRRALYEEERR